MVTMEIMNSWALSDPSSEAIEFEGPQHKEVCLSITSPEQIQEPREVSHWGTGQTVHK